MAAAGSPGSLLRAGVPILASETRNPLELVLVVPSLRLPALPHRLRHPRRIDCHWGDSPLFLPRGDAGSGRATGPRAGAAPAPLIRHHPLPGGDHAFVGPLRGEELRLQRRPAVVVGWGETC